MGDTLTILLNMCDVVLIQEGCNNKEIDNLPLSGLNGNDKNTSHTNFEHHENEVIDQFASCPDHILPLSQPGEVGRETNSDSKISGQWQACATHDYSFGLRGFLIGLNQNQGISNPLQR